MVEKTINLLPGPTVTFYQPQGNLNLHAGYSDIESSDQHVANVIEHLKKSPQWKDMLVVIPLTRTVAGGVTWRRPKAIIGGRVSHSSDLSFALCQESEC